MHRNSLLIKRSAGKRDDLVGGTRKMRFDKEVGDDSESKRSRRD